MRRRAYKTNLLTLFVLSFLCLNAGGALCLTYCLQPVSAASKADDAGLSDHCRRAKKDAEEKQKDSTKLTAHEASCCMMPVSLFAAPIEKATRLADPIVVADATPIPALPYMVSTASRVQPENVPVYRPPPLDRRTDRILHSVIRI